MRSLRPYQQQAINQANQQPGGCCGLFMAPGTGKTLTAIRAISSATHLPPQQHSVLIICRRDDFYTWENELILEKINPPYAIESGKDFLPNPNNYHRWFLVTYDLVKQERIFQWILNHRFQAIVCDESHWIKNPKAKRTKAVIAATRHIGTRLALTGTPISQEPHELFSQCLYLDNGRTFGTNFWKFLSTYYIKSGPGWYCRRNSKQRIQKKLKSIAYYIHEDDVLNLPRWRKLIKSCPQTPEQLKLTEDLINRWEIEIAKGKYLEVNYIITQVGKLKQIASGFYYDEEHNPIPVDHNKTKLLLRLVKEDLANESKIVIWGSYTAELKAIYDSISGQNSCVLFQGSNRRQKLQARQRFAQDKQVRFFVGQVDQGVGINELTCAKVAIYHSNSFRVVSRQQSLRRIRRIGSEIHPHITIYDLITENSIDKKVLSSVSKKMDLANEILNALKKGRKLRELL